MADKQDEIFIDVSKESTSNSVWNYFLRGTKTQMAKCTQCKQVLKILGGCTTPMHTHLRTKHNKILNKRKIDDTDAAGVNTADLATKIKTIKDFYISKVDESFAAVISRMVASDGLPFRIFCSSDDLRKCLRTREFCDIPKSPTSIQNVVMEYSKKIRQSIISEIISEKNRNVRFSLTLDEWTSSRNRRFMIVNVHGSGDRVWNLGLARINGRFASEDCIKLLEKKLESCQLNIGNDILCIVTDGASMMQKVGRLFPCEQILCFAHAIQIAIGNVLYKKQTLDLVDNTTENEVEQDNNENEPNFELDEENLTDDEDDDNGMRVDMGIETDAMETTENFQLRALITKVRKIVKTFRRSPLKNEVLQKYVKQDHKQELQLVLDSKIRWNSMLSMLERFNILKTSLKKALIDIKTDIILYESEWDSVSRISKNLMPVKLAVDALCRADANLISADATFTFLLQNFSENDEFALELKKEIELQFNRRRTILSDVLQYLHNGGKTKIHKSISGHSKTEINKIILLLARRLNDEITAEVDSTDSESDSDLVFEPNEFFESETQPSLQKLLQQKIQQSLLQPTTRILKKTSIQSAIRNELKFWDEGGSRGPFLEIIYKNLLCIPPTSVEAERAFSAAGAFSTKIRSRLNDTTLDNLCMLRSFFKKQT